MAVIKIIRMGKLIPSSLLHRNTAATDDAAEPILRTSALELSALIEIDVREYMKLKWRSE